MNESDPPHPSLFECRSIVVTWVAMMDLLLFLSSDAPGVARAGIELWHHPLSPSMWLPDTLALISLVGVAFTLPISVYLGLMTLCAWRTRAPVAQEAHRLVCVIPAHNEQAGIADTIHSLQEAQYPADQRRIVVIADNCDDRTADVARAAGAEVVERTDPGRRGKGYALELGFAEALKDSRVDGIIVVDADTVVSPNLWSTVSARLGHGAAAIQVANVVGNPEAGWRPRLMAIGMALMNGVRSLGRERLGLSVGLRGTGMAFARRTLERVPHRVYGVVEDVEYGVRLGLAGLRVVYAPEAWIASDAPVSAAAALSQRRRWEGGRAALVRTTVPMLLRNAMARRSPLLLDLAVDLAIPPLSYPALAAGGGMVLEGMHAALTGTLSPVADAWGIAVGLIAMYVGRGVLLSQTGLRGLATLGAAPVYVVWKVLVARPWRTNTTWVRTERARGRPHSASSG